MTAIKITDEETKSMYVTEFLNHFKSYAVCHKHERVVAAFDTPATSFKEFFYMVKDSPFQLNFALFDYKSHTYARLQGNIIAAHKELLACTVLEVTVEHEITDSMDEPCRQCEALHQKVSYHELKDAQGDTFGLINIACSNGHSGNTYFKQDSTAFFKKHGLDMPNALYEWRISQKT